MGRVVGFVVAIDGQLRAADIFATPTLFSTYATEVLDADFMSAVGLARSSSAPALSSAQAFIDRRDSGNPLTLTDGTFVYERLSAP